MNKDHKELIRANYRQLASAIAPQVDDIIRYLFEKQVISRSMMERLECKKTPSDQSYALLDLIISRGPMAFDHLHSALVEEKILEAANIMKPELASRENTVTVPAMKLDLSDDRLPDNWPSEDKDMESYKNIQCVEPKHTEMMMLYKASLTTAGQEHLYLMSSRPRGRALIINNEKFEHLDSRDGTLRDRQALETLFKAFYFDTTVVKNKKAAEMLDLLQAEVRKDEHNKANCFVLFILSHGHKGVVFGTDGYKQKNEGSAPATNGIREDNLKNCIEIKKIIELFSNAKSLQGKPKLFFIQACQGDEKNKGHSVGQADNSDTAVTGQQNPAPITTDNSGAVAAMECSGAAQQEAGDRQLDESITMGIVLRDVLPITKSDSGAQKRPSGADVFVAMATIPDFLSWRNTKFGTWFIQAIVYVFSKYAYKYDLGKLMTMVNNLVGRAETEKGGYKQVGEKRDTFQKDFYFFPGLCGSLD